MSLEIREFRLDDPHEPGRVVRGRVVAPPGFDDASNPMPHVLIVHGFKGFMDWGFFPDLAHAIAERGICAVAFNVSGSGIGEDPLELSETDAFAKNTVSREIDDVARVREHARSGALGALDPERAALLGHSRGGGVALLHAAEDGGYRAIVTWSAIDDVDRFDDDTKAMWREMGFITIHNGRTGQDHRIDLDALEDLEQNRARLDIVAACGRLAAPTLLVHGAADETVPVAAQERLAAALRAPWRDRLTVPGAGHTFGCVHPFAGETDAYRLARAASIEHLVRHLEPALG